ncbi:MAG: DUF2235 domain-containing protein [Alphaproteobacteria bacterium]|nr:DUF2235 domain-containing protein [Alphaproteobacteria bacterium]
MCSYDERKAQPRETIEAVIFFDGTGNNRKNVKTGSNVQDAKGSYASGYSNIAKMEWLCQPKVLQSGRYDHFFKIYVEGIGTENDGADETWDLATGCGSAGVREKVRKCFDSTIEQIDNFVKSRKISYIHIWAFGFSRGAAAARLYAFNILKNEGQTLKENLISRGYYVETVCIKFIGLFDTVASLGVKHSNDTLDLHLDGISAADRVVQLAAAEEHRQNFRLTNIASAKSKGLQIFLPGAHSDVGGGYRDTEDELNWQVFDLDKFVAISEAAKCALQRERDWLSNLGWYKPAELENTNFWNEIVANRRSINGDYSRIPLYLMMEYAESSGCAFNKDKLHADYPIPDGLLEVFTQIRSYITAVGTHSHPSDFWAPMCRFLSDAPKLRHDYLHFSARYGGTNGPQWTNDDPINGRRERVIQDG